MIVKMTTHTSKDTELVGELLAKDAFPGSVIVLEGQLGTGKTTLTKGIAYGLGIKQTIKSPTYTLIREYDAQEIPLYHMDMYRLEQSDAQGLGLEEYLYGHGISVVEWARFIAEELPLEYMEIHLHQPEQRPRQRFIRIRVLGQAYEAWLTEFLKHLKEVLATDSVGIEVHDE